MPDLDWLIARPVAHRGLHDAQNGVIENTASAFAAAIAGRYGIECDLQVSADGEAMVFHDHGLGRLTESSARLDAMSAADLKRVAFKATADRMLTLGELCELTAARATLVIELKSRFDGDRRLVARAVQVLSGYRGPAAVMSFDAAQIAAIRAMAPALPRGLIAQGRYRRSATSSWPPPSAAWPLSPMRCARIRNSSPIRSATCRRRCRRSHARFFGCRS